MLVQYLVGLCCLRRNPAAVEITLGDMVLDPAAGKERDVDVTVTLEEEPGVVRAFKAYEVKHEKAPLDVAVVEQLCLKLHDMPSVTHPAIVSSSDFTDGAKAKAAHHGVELYRLEAWTGRLEEEFPGFGMTGLPEETLLIGRSLLVWHDWKINLISASLPPGLSIEWSAPILTASGTPHERYSNFEELANELTLRSTQILCQLEPAKSVARAVPQTEDESYPLATPAWPHTHTMDVTKEEAYLKVNDQISMIEMVTIYGHLRWESSAGRRYVMRRVSDGEAFAGALIALGAREGEMNAFVISPTSTTVGVHTVQLNDKQRNLIRRLKLENPRG